MTSLTAEQISLKERIEASKSFCKLHQDLLKSLLESCTHPTKNITPAGHYNRITCNICNTAWLELTKPIKPIFIIIEGEST